MKRKNIFFFFSLKILKYKNKLFYLKIIYYLLKNQFNFIIFFFKIPKIQKKTKIIEIMKFNK